MRYGLMTIHSKRGDVAQRYNSSSPRFARMVWKNIIPCGSSTYARNAFAVFLRDSGVLGRLHKLTKLTMRGTIGDVNYGTGYL